MFLKSEQNGKVHKVAEELRSLNGLDENALNVRYESYHEIIYAGDLSKLNLPEGYYVSTYNDRGTERASITNKGNTGTNSWWTFVVSPR